MSDASAEPEVLPDTGRSEHALTRGLARFVAESTWDDVPATVRHEARRALLHWVGCAIGGSRHETIDRALRALARLRGNATQGGLFGRTERVATLQAALLNGMSSHVLDFDDTQLGATNVHPSGPVAAALFALCEVTRASGQLLLHSYLLGIEVACRVANSVFAEDNRGWHVTGAVGMLGAAAACSKLLELEERRIVWALGSAATQVVGLREMFGSMCKSLHVGRAAENGLLAAVLAAEGFTSGDAALEGAHGFARVASDKPHLEAMLDALGQHYEISRLSFKPFACGIVIHPSIDACIQLRTEHGLVPEEIERIHLRVHPDALTATGKSRPRTGMEAKFSVYHAAAVALIDGTGGEAQFSDARVANPRVVALRERVRAEADPAVRKDEVYASLLLKNGRTLDKHIDHALGSLDRPMSDRDLEQKYHFLADAILGHEPVDRLLQLCWNVTELDDAAEVLHASVPRNGARS